MVQIQNIYPNICKLILPVMVITDSLLQFKAALSAYAGKITYLLITIPDVQKWCYLRTLIPCHQYLLNTVYQM